MSTSSGGEHTTKRCTKCRQRKPLTEFRKYPGRSSDGLRPLCRQCQRVYEKQWRLQNQAKLAEARQRRREKDRQYRHQYIDRNWAKYMIDQIRRRCEKTGIPFDLDQHEDDLNRRRQVGRCELTGLPLRASHGPQSWDSPSIDRIDPTIGYLYSNIRVVCFGVNAALGSWGNRCSRELRSHTWPRGHDRRASVRRVCSDSNEEGDDGLTAEERYEIDKEAHLGRNHDGALRCQGARSAGS